MFLSVLVTLRCHFSTKNPVALSGTLVLALSSTWTLGKLLDTSRIDQIITKFSISSKILLNYYLTTQLWSPHLRDIHTFYVYVSQQTSTSVLTGH